jgi:hypothetical protein
VCIEDVTGDGRNDIVATSSGDVKVLVNSGSGGFAPTDIYGAGGACSLLPGDFNKEGERYLADARLVDLRSGSLSNVSLTLHAGDANDDNICDVEDLALIIQSFDYQRGQTNYIPGADLNADGIVDVDDLALLIQNFDGEGAP